MIFPKWKSMVLFLGRATRHSCFLILMIYTIQHGFVPGLSMQTQILSYFNYIYDTLKKEKKLDSIFLDFAKAFDKVAHAILLEKNKIKNNKW